MRKTVSLILALTLCLALSIPALALRSETDQAYPVIGGNLYYSKSHYEDGTESVMISDVDATVTELTIPEQIEGVTVKILDLFNLRFSNLLKLTIPASVELLGVDSIHTLTDVTVAAGNPKYASVDGVLFSKDLTELLYFPSGRDVSAYTIPNTVTKIGNSAFAESKLTGITIPEGVTEIGWWAFSGCPLTSVTIPEGVTKISIGAFSSCENLTSVALPASLTTLAFDAFWNSENLKDIYYAGSEAQWNAIGLIEMDYDGTFSITKLEGLDHITVHYNGETAPATQPATPPAPAAKPVVLRSPQKLSVNGEAVATEMYNIDNTNYFKLRDLAAMLDGTANQFNVDFDAARDVIVVTTGVPYTTANGQELQTGVDNSKTAQPSAQSLEIDGKAVDGLTVYNIGGTNFFGLRSLEAYLGYEVGYVAETNTATITSK